MKRKANGPNDSAFPRTIEPGNDAEGLTVREYFAGQALIGLLAGRDPEVNLEREESLAAKAFRLADALIAESWKEIAPCQSWK